MSPSYNRLVPLILSQETWVRIPVEMPFHGPVDKLVIVTRFSSWSLRVRVPPGLPFQLPVTQLDRVAVS